MQYLSKDCVSVFYPFIMSNIFYLYFKKYYILNINILVSQKSRVLITAWDRHGQENSEVKSGGEWVRLPRAILSPPPPKKKLYVSWNWQSGSGPRRLRL